MVSISAFENAYLLTPDCSPSGNYTPIRKQVRQAIWPKSNADHAWDTWRTPAGPAGRLWLRDDLPQYLPESRIFLYEYNSTAVYGKDRSTFIDKANTLLEAIRLKRRGAEQRPLLLLGHSLGGLLIKQALINAHNNEKYDHVKTATTGLAFFATPHDGGNKTLVSIGAVAAKIAVALGFQKGDDILETLDSGSMFSDIMHEHWRQRLLEYDIVSFWGTLDEIVPKESTSFGLPGKRENVVALQASHSGQRPDLLSDEIFDKFEADRNQILHSFSGLWEILITVASHVNAGELICVLDALDECEERGRSRLAGDLSKLYESKTSTFALKFLLTSRPYASIQREFQILENSQPTIHLSGENEVEVDKISQEIDLVIKVKVEDLGARLNLQREEMQFLHLELTRVPNRTYLWVYLVFDVLRSGIEHTQIGLRETIRKLPRTVGAAYEKILSRSRDIDKARRLLHIVVAATRPLSLEEMAFALAMREDYRSFGDIQLEPEGHFRRTVRDLCGLFVAITDGKIYLLHQTAKEFLVQRTPSNQAALGRSTGSLCWQNSFIPVESNRILAEICIWHLLLAGSEPEDSDHIFLDYSAKNWAHHFREAFGTCDKKLQTSALRLCDTGLGLGLDWFTIYWTTTKPDPPEGFTTLMVASYFGLDTLVPLLLDHKDVRLDSRDAGFQRSALSWASGNGHERVVALLLSRVSKTKEFFRNVVSRSIVNSKDENNQTPLLHAVANGHVGIVKMLLEKGAKVDNKDSYGQTPLSWAAYSEHETIVRLLLVNGARLKPEDGFLESRDRRGQTPLLRAAHRGQDGVVQMLLDKGAYMEAKDDDGRTPLIHATNNGHEGIVRILLDKGAYMEAKG
ncbi:hypothetical protein DL768_004359 [Monosporascus sp. mg162]|nr:hypothetical protein DL768_004359 [Monosporascus sp. mg162]